MEKHREILQRLCRLCGERSISSADSKKGKVAKLCSNYIEKIADSFQVDISHDDTNIHPPHMCHTCYTRLYLRAKKTAPTWGSHTITGVCPVCTYSIQHLSSGRKKRKKHPGIGRPRITPTEFFNSLPQSPTVSREKMLNFEPLSYTSPILCKICNRSLNNALETSCMHLFCCECLTERYETSGERILPCPTCQKPVDFKHVVAPRLYFASLFLSTIMTCKACKVGVPLGDISSHGCDPKVSSGPSGNPNLMFFIVKPPEKQVSEVVEMMHRPLTAPLTPQMEELGSHFLKSKLAQSSDGFSTRYKTAGLPLTTVCIPSPRKSSEVASSKTLRRRSEILNKTRNLLSMGTSRRQHLDELKLSSLRDNLQETLKELKLDSIRLPSMQLLAAKARFGISWKRIREMKRWLKSYNILTEGENAMRQQQKDIVASNIIAENLPFSFPDEVNGGVTIKPAACVGVKSLVAKVTQQFEEYHKAGQLTWHEGNIPADEVWIKIGGDKGGGTFKQMFQIANIDCPNCLRHTVVACAFAAGDKYDNLKTGLLRFRQQVVDLQSCTLKSHKIRLFMFGDYEYLTRVYGLSGASGRHCCLYCEVSKDDMSLPQEERPATRQRTLDTLNNDLARFVADGSKLSHAKHFNNVISPPMFRLPLTQVCPPGLHISLGLYLKHFNSFERACHDLDMEVAAVLAVQKGQQSEADNPALGSTFKNVVSVLKKARQLELQAEGLDEEIQIKEEELMDIIMTSEEEEESGDIGNYIAGTTLLREQKERLLAEVKALREKAALKPGQGPLVGLLDIVLQEFRVQRQAFGFVGNHVHKCCKEENIKRLTDAVVSKTRELCPSLEGEAREISTKYSKLFNLFGTCHRKYNVAFVLNDQAIETLNQDIRNYLAFFRSSFPSETTTPKMHLLEEHVIPWLRRWRFGLGFHGEHGGESVHAHFNTLRRDVRGLSTDVDILRSVMQTHWVTTSPAYTVSR